MTFDYSYDGTMRSFEDSLQRLALERIDMLFIHDIDRYTRGEDQPEVFEQAMDGCWRALEQLRSQGAIKAIGVGVNEWEVCHEALKRRDFDCFLLAGRYTLLEQEALDDFLPFAKNVAPPFLLAAASIPVFWQPARFPAPNTIIHPLPNPLWTRWRKSRLSAAITMCHCQRPRFNSSSLIPRFLLLRRNADRRTIGAKPEMVLPPDSNGLLGRTEEPKTASR